MNIWYLVNGLLTCIKCEKKAINQLFKNADNALDIFLSLVKGVKFVR